MINRKVFATLTVTAILGLSLGCEEKPANTPKPATPPPKTTTPPATPTGTTPPPAATGTTPAPTGK